MVKRFRIKGKFQLTLVIEGGWFGFWWRRKKTDWVARGFDFWYSRPNALAIGSWGGEGSLKKMLFGFIRNSGLEDFYSGDLINPPRWDLCLFGRWFSGPKLLNDVEYTILKNLWRASEVRDRK